MATHKPPGRSAENPVAAPGYCASLHHPHMNWLAHLYLSEPTPAFRVGNLLPDLLPRTDLATLPAMFHAGIACHRRIDAFTDAHPIVRRSIARIPPPFRRFGGIFVDVLYDHFLTLDWAAHSRAPLRPFLAQVYGAFADCRPLLPAVANERLAQICAEDWLGSYRELDGVRRALDRLGQRLRKPRALGDAIPLLHAEHAALRADFREFFPALARHAAASPPGRVVT